MNLHGLVKYLSNRAFHFGESTSMGAKTPGRRHFGASLIFIREISSPWRKADGESPIAVLLALLETGLSTFLCP